MTVVDADSCIKLNGNLLNVKSMRGYAAAIVVGGVVVGAAPVVDVIVGAVVVGVIVGAGHTAMTGNKEYGFVHFPFVANIEIDGA